MFGTTVAGSVRHKSGQRCDSAHMAVDILDFDGQRVGTSLANSAGPRPGEMWRFEAV